MAVPHHQADRIGRFIKLGARLFPFLPLRHDNDRTGGRTAGLADFFRQVALCHCFLFIPRLDGQRPVPLFHHQTLVVFHRGVHVLLRMQRQPFTAFRILKQQLVVPFPFVGLGAEGHLGFAARQPARRDVAGVIGAPGDDRLVRVAVQEVHHHFLADTGDGQHAPALSGPRLGDAYPAGAVVITVAVTVPRKLEADAPVLVTEDFFPRRAHDFGDLRAVNHRFRQRGRAPALVMADKAEMAVQGGAAVTGGGFPGLRLAAGVAGPHNLPRLVEVRARVVGQGEQPARLDRDGVSAALPHYGVVAQRFKAVAGEGCAVRFVLKAARVVVMLVIHLLQGFFLHLRPELGPPGRVFEGVVFEFNLGRAHLCAVGQAAHGRLAQGAAFAGLIRDDDARRDGAGIVGKHQGVTAVTAFKEVEDALFRRQALQENKVTFLILHAEFPLGMRMAQAEHHVADAVLFQEGGDDGGNVLLLEDARVLAQGRAPQVRANGHLVGGLVQPGVTLLKAGHHSRDAALFNALLQDGQGRGAVKDGRKVNGRVGTRQPDIQVERLGKAFRQVEVGDDKGLRRQPRRRLTWHRLFAGLWLRRSGRWRPWPLAARAAKPWPPAAL